MKSRAKDTQEDDDAAQGSALMRRGGQYEVRQDWKMALSAFKLALEEFKKGKSPSGIKDAETAIAEMKRKVMRDAKANDVLPVPVAKARGAAKDAKPPAKGMFVEFYKKPGQFFKLSSNSDAAMDAAVKQAGLWKKGADYPDFTVYKDGEETTGGGGPNSGVMDSIQSEGDDVLPVPVTKARGAGRDEAMPSAVRKIKAEIDKLGPSYKNPHGYDIPEWRRRMDVFRKDLIPYGYKYDGSIGVYRDHSLTPTKDESFPKGHQGRDSIQSEADDVLPVPVNDVKLTGDKPGYAIYYNGKRVSSIYASKSAAEFQQSSLYKGQGTVVKEIRGEVQDESFPKGPSSPREKAGLSVQEWNALPAARRKELIGAKDSYDYEASGDLKQDVEDALKILAERDLGAEAIRLKYGYALDFVKDVLSGKFGAGRGAITAYFKAHPWGGPGQANDAKEPEWLSERPMDVTELRKMHNQLTGEGYTHRYSSGAGKGVVHHVYKGGPEPMAVIAERASGQHGMGYRNAQAKDSIQSEGDALDLQDAVRILKEHANEALSAAEIVSRHGYSLQFVLDVLGGRYGRTKAEMAQRMKSSAKDVKFTATELQQMAREVLSFGGPDTEDWESYTQDYARAAGVSAEQLYEYVLKTAKAKGWANDAAKDAEQAKSFSGSTSREARQKAKSYADSLRAQGYEIIWVVPTGVYSYEVAYKTDKKGKVTPVPLPYGKTNDASGPEKLDVVDTYRGHSIWKVKTAGGAIRYMPVPQGGGVSGLYTSPQELKDEIDRVNKMLYASAKDYGEVLPV